MKTAILLKKLHLEKKEFVTSAELKKYERFGEWDYTKIIKNLERRKYLVRIFRGIFYVKTINEIYDGKHKYSNLELIAKGLEIKNIPNWYFGLYTALRLNNMTHEYFTINDVMSDSIFRSKPILIANQKFNFKKIINPLFEFGIKKHGLIKYSNPEKTILDFIYLWKANGKTEKRIIIDISEWLKNISKKKIKKYSKNYPKSVQKIIGEIKYSE